MYYDIVEAMPCDGALIEGAGTYASTVTVNELMPMAHSLHGTKIFRRIFKNAYRLPSRQNKWSRDIWRDLHTKWSVENSPIFGTRLWCRIPSSHALFSYCMESHWRLCVRKFIDDKIIMNWSHSDGYLERWQAGSVQKSDHRFSRPAKCISTRGCMGKVVMCC